MSPEKRFMDMAIKEAMESARQGDYPIGAVIVKSGKAIASGRSAAMRNKDPTSHAEVEAIRKAAAKMCSMYLEGCVLYTTLEPCAMCAAAAVWAKMKGIVYGASIEDAMEFAESVKDRNISLSYRQIHIKCRDILKKSDTKLELIEGFERERCLRLLELGKQCDYL